MAQSECGEQGCSAPSIGFLLVHVVEDERADPMVPTVEYVLPMCNDHRALQPDARFRLWATRDGAPVRPTGMVRD